MASKKGIAVTAIILAAITGASFLLWIVPQDVETTFVVSDYENYLDGVKNIHEVLEESIEIEYENLKHQYPQAGTGKSRVPKELIDKLVDKYIPKDEDKTEDE